MIYLGIIIYLLFLVYNYDIKQHRGGEKHSFFLLCILICVAGLSYRLGIDSVRYEEKFYSFTSTIRISDLFGGGVIQMEDNEPLWVLLNRACMILFGEFQYMKFIIAVFVNCTIFWFLKKHSSVFFTSVLLYFLLAFANLNFQILRESLAICFFLIALDSLIGDRNNTKKKYIQYYLWIIPALLCHRFAVVTLIFPLLLNIKLNAKFFVIMLVTLVMVIPFMGQILEFIIDKSYLNTLLLDYMVLYAENESYGLHSMNIFGYIEIFVLTIIPFLFFIRYYKDDIFMSLALLYIIFYILDTASFGILYRVNNYLVYPMIIALSGAIRNAVYEKNYKFQALSVLKNHSLAVLCLALFLGVQIVRFVSNEKFSMYYPYSSVMTKQLDKDREAIYSSIGI